MAKSAEEIAAEEEARESEEPDGQPDTTPSEPSDDALVTLPTGEVVEYGELKKGYSRTQDYTTKTQDAAELKREADARMAEAEALQLEAEGDKAQANLMREAMDRDVEWYRTHPAEQWNSYKPEVNKVGTEPTASAAAPQADSQENKVLRARVDKLEAKDVKTEKDKAVDSTMDSMREFAESPGLELCTPKLLHQAVQAHQASNKGVLPDHGKIKKMATEIHEDLANMGTPIPRGEIPEVGTRKGRPGSGTSAEKEPAWKNLNLRREGRKVSAALGDFMTDIQNRKG